MKARYSSQSLVTHWTLPLIAALAAVLPSGAATFFSLTTGVHGQTTVIKTVDGITMTLSNPSPNATFFGSAEGLVLNVNLSSFNLEFDKPVQFTGYDVSTAGSSGTPTFTLSGPNGDSAGNTLTPAGVRTSLAGGPFTLAPGEVGSLTAIEFGSLQLVRISTFEVTLVPEPLETSAAAAVVCGVVGIIVHRRRARWAP